jgi:hypothetical protein
MHQKKMLIKDCNRYTILKTNNMKKVIKFLRLIESYRINCMMHQGWGKI